VYQWKLTQAYEVAEPVLHMPRTPLFLRGDPLRIQQIIVNLLNNSVQAKAPDRMVQLTVEVLEQQGHDMAEIRIQDNGLGISSNHSEYVFEAFFRGSDKQSTLRGLGLGLTFSRLLAEAMNGSLVLEEHSEEGCTFVLTLPLDH
jgi:signal transduction histidine kinase